MAAAARHARAAESAPHQEQDARPSPPAYAYRAPRTRKRAAHRARLMRAFVIFVACLTVLAVGRVALSFAVVQKSLQTDAVVREERRLSDENDRLEGKLAQMASPVLVRHIAETQLGLVDASHVLYLEPLLPTSSTRVAASQR